MPPDASFVVRASAPGRVNLIGEHTDYNGGFVLPTAIPQQTRVELNRRHDQTIEIESAEEATRGTYAVGNEQRRGDWVDYIQGLTWALRGAGIKLDRGFEMRVSSD